MSEQAQVPIFVLGIYPRSGTNYLMNLIRVHPDCAPPTPIWEDFLLTHSNLLDAYVLAVSRHWNPNWGARPEHTQSLLAALGDGIAGFLQDLAGDAPRVVTKTPRVDRLELFGTLFPRACLLILVRDGRAVVESGVRSFGWFRDAAIHGWAEAARTVMQFDAAERSGMLRYRIVRYEELVADQEATLREILPFLGLDAARYDFQKAAGLPVQGSSTLRRLGERVHWKGVERRRDFHPIGRWRQWSRWQHARFNWVAGEALLGLGYVPEPTAGGASETAWNRLMDLRYLIARALRPAVRRWPAR